MSLVTPVKGDDGATQFKKEKYILKKSQDIDVI
jgi:hypothetical protein